MKKLVYEVLAEVARARSNERKIEILRQNDSGALRDILRGSMDKTIVWLLPSGAPPYSEARPESVPSNLLKECKKFAYLVKGGLGPNLDKIKREAIFINILEVIHPDDAKVVINTINKIPPKGITRNIVKEAFPGLLKD